MREINIFDTALSDKQNKLIKDQKHLKLLVHQA